MSPRPRPFFGGARVDKVRFHGCRDDKTGRDGQCCITDLTACRVAVTGGRAAICGATLPKLKSGTGLGSQGLIGGPQAGRRAGTRRSAPYHGRHRGLEQIHQLPPADLNHHRPSTASTHAGPAHGMTTCSNATQDISLTQPKHYHHKYIQKTWYPLIPASGLETDEKPTRRAKDTGNQPKRSAVHVRLPTKGTQQRTKERQYQPPSPSG